jgi:Tol biopolymer transport system component
MTDQRDFDRLIHTFMDEGPAELSPRLLSSIRDEINGTRQRTLPRPWRTLSMPRPILIFAVLGALLTAFVAMTLVGTGGRPQATAPSASPPAPGSPSPAASPAGWPLVDGEAWILVGADFGSLLVRPDGTDRHVILGDLPVHPVTPRWSPDGRQIVFEGNGDRGSQVWIANADGTGARAVTATPDGCPDGTCTEGVQPAWSPDGRSIAYVAPTHEQAVFTRTALSIVDIATGATTELYSTAEASLGRPSWSPDGRSIVLDILRYEGIPEITTLASTVIAVVDVAGVEHTPRELTEPRLLAGYPSWHPTSDLIVFRTNRFSPETSTLQDPAAASDLYTIRADGSGLAQVTDNGVDGPIVRGPTWTPDGRILYGRLDDPNADEYLTVIDANGSGEESATGGLRTIGEGHWRPGT